MFKFFCLTVYSTYFQILLYCSVAFKPVSVLRPVAGKTVRVKGEFLPWGCQLLGLSLKQLSQRAPAHSKRDQNRKGQRRPVFRLVKVKTGASQSQQMTVLSQKKTWTYIERKTMTKGIHRGKMITKNIYHFCSFFRNKLSWIII